MSRITTTILVVMLLANGTVTIMETSGLSEDIGVELAPGISEQMDTLIEEMKGGFQPDVSVVESLVTVFIAAGRVFLILLKSLYALPSMMINLGFPEYIVTAFFAPAYLLSTMEMIYLLTGRSMN